MIDRVAALRPSRQVPSSGCSVPYKGAAKISAGQIAENCSQYSVTSYPFLGPDIHGSSGVGAVGCGLHF